MILERLPPESRTKTAQRDEIDPHVMAEMMAALPPGKGWGPHSRTDELLMRIGERLDHLAYIIPKLVGAKPKEPQPWRRPGVLGPQDQAELEAELAAPVIADLNAERAAREARRKAERSRQ